MQNLEAANLLRKLQTDLVQFEYPAYTEALELGIAALLHQACQSGDCQCKKALGSERDWLLDQIDGGDECRGRDSVISDRIRLIEAAITKATGVAQ